MDKLRFGAAQKAFGIMVAEVAHDLNNPLAILHGYTHELVRMIQPEAKINEDLLKKALPKFEKNIAKMVELTKFIGESRRSDKFAKQTLNLASFLRRWSKVTNDSLKTAPLNFELTWEGETQEATTSAVDLILALDDATEILLKAGVQVSPTKATISTTSGSPQLNMIFAVNAPTLAVKIENHPHLKLDGAELKLVFPL